MELIWATSKIFKTFLPSLSIYYLPQGQGWVGRDENAALKIPRDLLLSHPTMDQAGFILRGRE